MAYFDDVTAQRRAIALAEAQEYQMQVYQPAYQVQPYQAPVIKLPALQPVGDQFTATDGVRGRGWGALILGALLCLTPLIAVGIVTAAIGIGFLLVTPALEKAEAEADAAMRNDMATGGTGCGAALWLCFIGAVMIFGATLIMAALGIAVIGGIHL